MDEIEEVESEGRRGRICLTDKLILSYICINVDCKYSRYVCAKCAKKHDHHKSDLV